MSQNKEPEPTRLESAAEILKALEARKAKRQATAAPAGPPGSPAPTVVPDAEARRERPCQRPPMALLCVLDDGRQEGEWVRLRADRTVIGRGDGDVRVAHDVQMSGRHAEVVREHSPAGWRWLLRDLESRNGTFVRVGATVLRHGNEVLIGQGRYRFEAANAPADGVTTAPELATGVTQMPQPLSGSLRALVPSLVEVTAAGPVQRTLLTQPEYWFGREARAGAIARPDDPFVDAQHARLYRDKAGQWHVANNASVNGLWLRVKTIALDKACQFRLGEQRFLFRVC